MIRARFLLDTNIVIFIRSGRKLVMERFRALQAGEAVLSIISYGELRFGAERSRDRRAVFTGLAELTERLPVESLPLQAADHYAEIRADLSRRGELIGPNDLWIAAHARSVGLTLVTNNEREFRRVPGLSVENWAAAA